MTARSNAGLSGVVSGGKETRSFGPAGSSSCWGMGSVPEGTLGWRAKKMRCAVG